MMTTESATDKWELTELANKLFMYTDAQQWPRLLEEVFAENIWFDISSAGGGEARLLPAKEVTDIWKQGFAQLDAVHHQAGHYLIEIIGLQADIYAYAVATHYRKAATKGMTRTFVGSYELKAKQTADGWKLTQFKYNLKYMDGNIGLE